MAANTEMEQALTLFQAHWGHKKFRLAQARVIEAALRGEDVLAVLPTGYGKSAAFQVPALVREGTAIVVSPLIALMKDQTDDCISRGIPASYVNSHVDIDEQQERLSDMAAGAYKVFYIAPERVNNRMFKDALQQTDVSFFVVDECHCVSRWGHDFRPAYSRIKEMVDMLKIGDERPPIIAVTATATRDIEDDVATGLGMDAGYTRIVGDPIRPNLRYEVMHGNEWGNLRHLIKTFNPTSGRYIIYCGTRRGSEKVAEMVSGHHEVGVCGVYHAGMTKPEREKIQNNFKSGRTPVIVATCAFGMGIDVPDIRVVAHFGIPGSLEDYCQESGRAGRDGKHSLVVIIHSDYAIELRQMFLDSANPPYEVYEEVWDFMHANTNEGETLRLSGAEIAKQIERNGGGRVHGNAVSGALSTMEAHGLVHRAYAGAGTVVEINTGKLQTAVEDGSFSGQSSKIADYLWTDVCNEEADGVLRAEIDLSTASSAIGLPEASIRRAMKKLEGTVEIEVKFLGKTSRLLKYDEDLHELLPRESIDAKRNREIARLRKMVTYCHTSDRVKHIRDYFMEGL